MDMTDVNSSDLSGAALDWAVAVVVHGKVYVYPDGGFCPPEDTVSMNDDDGSLWVNSGIDPHPKDSWSPSTDWSQGGPLMDDFCKGFGMLQDGTNSRWRSFSYNPKTGMQRMLGGETILVAFCRALVALKLGEVVSVPKELVDALPTD